VHVRHWRGLDPASPPAAGHDANLAEWLDGGRSDQVFVRWGTVVEDSSLGLAIVERIEESGLVPPSAESPH